MVTKRKPAAPTSNRPPPPDGLPEHAARLWRTICDGLPSNYFSGADLTLLEAFVMADAQKRDCDALVALHGPLLPDGTINPAAKLSISYAGAIASLSGKLRLCKSSTTRAESAPLKKAVAGQGRVRDFDPNDELIAGLREMYQ